MTIEQKENTGMKMSYEIHLQGLEWLTDSRERELSEYAWGFYASNGKNMTLLAKEAQLDKGTAFQILSGAKMLFGRKRSMRLPR